MPRKIDSVETLTGIQSSFKTAQSVLDSFISSPENLEAINDFAHRIASTIQSGGKIISCGNGGSMCDAMHFAEELTGARPVKVEIKEALE